MALPDKELYGLTDCAQRWGCAVEDVLEYLRMGLIVPAIRHDAITVEIWEGMSQLPDPDTGLPDDGDLIDRKQIEKGWSYLPYFRFHKLHRAGNLEHLRLSQCALADQPRNPPHLLLLADKEKDQDIPLMDLYVPGGEAEVFDRYVLPHAKPLGGKERDNLYRMIGVLARLLIVPVSSQAPGPPKSATAPKAKLPHKGSFGSLQAPNVSHIAEVMLDHLSEFNISAVGLSNSAIRERLSKAFDLLNAEMPPAGGGGHPKTG